MDTWMRDRIDCALAACEEINAAGRQRPPRWVRDLVVELQRTSGSLVWEPADTVEAHAELLDLQVHHLDTPPREALAEALGLLAHARGETRQLRERLAAAETSVACPPPPVPTSDLAILREIREQLQQLAVAVAALRAESRPQADATTAVPLPAGGSLADTVAAVRSARRIASEADLEEIAAAGGATLAMLRGPSRRAALVELRRVAARYLRARGCSLPEIGEALNRDHTTVLNLLGSSARARHGALTLAEAAG